MKIIPAIDLIDGKCVRLTKGDYSSKKIYNENPVEVAKSFEDAGIQYLHLVDLDGAKASQIINYPVLERITRETNLTVDFGGGLKSDEDLKIAFESGATKVTGGSIAIQKPTVFSNWIEKYGDKIILGADCLDRRIATQGWTEISDLDVVNFIQKHEREGISEVICTDISKDGMLAGPSVELYAEILRETSVQLIASGGVSSLQDLVVLRNLGCSGVIIGKAIYEGRISLKQLSLLC